MNHSSDDLIARRIIEDVAKSYALEKFGLKLTRRNLQTITRYVISQTGERPLVEQAECATEQLYFGHRTS